MKPANSESTPMQTPPALSQKRRKLHKYNCGSKKGWTLLGKWKQRDEMMFKGGGAVTFI